MFTTEFLSCALLLLLNSSFCDALHQIGGLCSSLVHATVTMNLARHQQDRLFNDFRQHVKNHHEEGQDSNGNRALFIGQSVLKEWWNPQRINDILKATVEHSASISTDNIRKHRIIILSILVYISTTTECFLPFLQDFIEEEITDDTRPWGNRLPRCFSDPANQALLEKFEADKWLFCPLNLGLDACWGKKIGSLRVLPFVAADPPRGRPLLSTAKSATTREANIEYMKLSDSEAALLSIPVCL